jgi:hypothetical protein
MGRIDDALLTLEGISDPTERALQLAGLISTLFKIKGVVLVLTNQLAFDGYANTMSERPEIELAVIGGELAPRDILDVMRGQLRGAGSLYRWTVAGTPVRLESSAVIAHRKLCRDFTTDLGVVKLVPAEEITADYILASVHPEPDPDAEARAHLLLVNGLADAFHMDWTVLHALCHRPSHRIGEELARMRLAAKRDVDAMGAGRDHIGETVVLPTVTSASIEATEPPAEISEPTASLATPEPPAPEVPAIPPSDEGGTTTVRLGSA